MSRGEARDQQAAMAEVLRVIASKSTDLQPVFDAIAESAARDRGTDDAMIRMMGGDLTVTSTHGQGSRFTVTLPAAAPEAGP